MALFARLVGTEEPKLSVHAFAAALFDYVDGEATSAQIASAFGLSAAEQTDLGAVLTKIDGLATTAARHFWTVRCERVLMLAEGGYRYTTQAAAKTRLGL